MPPTTIRTAPELDSFTPLAEHQSQTPTSFYDSKPVLYFHATSARALIPRDQSSALPIFGGNNGEVPNRESVDGEDSPSDGSYETETVDVFVTSESLTLFSPAKSVGVSIPYPTIALHAIQRMPDPIDIEQQIQCLYMQLEFHNDQEDENDDEPESIDLRLLTAASGSLPNAPTNSIQALYDAVTNCSNLHPDSQSRENEDMDEGDDRIVFEGSVGYEGISGLPGVLQGANDGGLPPPFPGSGGWITAENVGEYFDAGGNWIGGEEDAEPLGEGAGHVRGRDELEDGEQDAVAVNGHGTNGDESKRPRTE